MGTEATDPPPQKALRCPSPDRHSQIIVREGHFRCETCAELGMDATYNTVMDTRTTPARPIPHSVFVAAWGTDLEEW